MNSARTRRWLLWLAFAAVNAAPAATFTVTTTNDSGAGTLRQAILDSNATPGKNEIHFNLPGGGEQSFFYFFPTPSLPGISNSVVIDGYTQPGAKTNTLAFGGNNAVVLINIWPSFGGIIIQATNVAVRGLGVRQWGDNGGFRLIGGGSNVIEGCLIGTDATTKLNLSYGSGRHAIDINNSSNNRIGGTNAAARNVIGYSLNTGIAVRSGTNNAILGNAIFAVEGYGIHLNYPLIFRTTNDPADADTGANNLQNYPVLTNAATAPQGVLVQGNLQSTSNRTYRVEFFSSPVCVNSNYAFAREFVGWTDVTADSNGQANFSVILPAPVPAGWFLTATATDPDGNTSEFSGCFQVPGAQYVMKSLGSLGRSLAQGNALNNRGEAVGYAFAGLGDTTHAFLSINGAMTDLGTLGGPHSWAWAINDQTVVVGAANLPESGPADRTFHAFRWANGVMQDLGTLPGGTNSLATDINNQGQIVGYSGVPDPNSRGLTHAFLWQNNVMTDLGTLPGHLWSEAWAISENGDVFGASWAPQGPFARDKAQAFLYRNGQMSPLADLPPLFGLPARFNLHGDLAVSVLPGDGATHGFVRLAGMTNDFGLFGGSSGQGNDVNASGWAVGFASTPRILSDPGTHAVLFRDGTVYDLNALVLNGPGTVLRTATAINDDGQILVNNVGQSLSVIQIGQGGANQTNVFLLLPIRLKIEPIGSNIALSWFTNLDGFSLQSTTNLIAPNSWTGVAGGPSVIGDRFYFTNNLAGGAKFFRLFKP